MAENHEFPSYMCLLPTELLLNLFTYLPAADLMRCRQVCCRWKSIIDNLIVNDELWVRFCKRDYPAVYRRCRSHPCATISSYDFYKSLYLWRKLDEAWEDSDEFASAAGLMQEVRTFQLIHPDTIGVLSKSAITYYDVHTLEISTREAIAGSYSRYCENYDVLVIGNYELHMFIIYKTNSCLPEEPTITFDSVKLFTLTNEAVYFVTIDDNIYMCELFRPDKSLTQTYMGHSDHGVLAMGVKNNQLNFLTMNKTIYTIVNNETVFQCTLGRDSNLFYQLQIYNLLDHMDWRVYIQWMHVFRHKVPDGLFQDLVTVRQYGDMFFAGSNWGVLRIYYVPKFDMNIDLFSMEPVKQYNFMERVDCPVLATCPIIGIDIVEIKHGHRVFVAMPKKVAVITFTHSFKRKINLAILPYDEVQQVKMLKLRDLVNN